MNKRSLTLDALRIFSALWVLSYHLSGRGGFYAILHDPYDVSWWPSVLAGLSSTGMLGVDLFFILSGAVISSSSLFKCPGAFARSRFLRLFPVYFFASALSLIVAPIAANMNARSEYALSLSGLQFWVGGESIIGASWTLAVEVGFYFLVFLALYLCKMRTIVFDQSALLKFLSLWLFLTVTSSVVNVSGFSYFIIPQYAPYFILGAITTQIKSLGDFKKCGLILSISLILSVRTFKNRIPDGFENDLWLYFLFIVFVVFIFLGGLETSSRRFKFIETLSLMTYPLYLLHETFGMSMISIIAHRGIGQRVSFFAVLSIIFLISWLFVKYIEPLTRRNLSKFC